MGVVVALAMTMDEAPLRSPKRLCELASRTAGPVEVVGGADIVIFPGGEKPSTSSVIPSPEVDKKEDRMPHSKVGESPVKSPPSGRGSPRRDEPAASPESSTDRKPWGGCDGRALFSTPTPITSEDPVWDPSISRTVLGGVLGCELS